MNVYHVPALAEQVIDLLDINPSGTYVDVTFGGGGHSRLILRQLGENGRLFGFDQDADAVQNVPEDPRFTFIRSNFKFMRNQLRALRVTEVDGIIADLGVSFHHFDTPERGFSFRFESELDMRMNRHGRLSAKNVIADYSVEDLTRIFRDYGEVDRAYKIACDIVEARNQKPIDTVEDLISAVSDRIPAKEHNKFLSKLFQALRIEVNNEIDALEMALEQSLKVLKPGGRLAVISYHSLEDRLVKNFMRSGTFEGGRQKDFYGHETTPWKLVTRKAILPSEEEIERNPRSRSAKLRVAEKL